MRDFPIGLLVSWVPNILITLGIIAYGAMKLADHQRPATRVIVSGCISLFGTLCGIASYWFLISGASRIARRVTAYSVVSFGIQAIHITATILLLSAVFTDRKPPTEAMQSFPPQMR